jgi:hypothetical protein
MPIYHAADPQFQICLHASHAVLTPITATSRCCCCRLGGLSLLTLQCGSPSSCPLLKPSPSESAWHRFFVQVWPAAAKSCKRQGRHITPRALMCHLIRCSLHNWPASSPLVNAGGVGRGLYVECACWQWS